MNSSDYKKRVNPYTAEALSIPETMYKWNLSAYMVRKLAKECGAYVKVGGVTRILQPEFSSYIRSLASKENSNNQNKD